MEGRPADEHEGVEEGEGAVEEAQEGAQGVHGSGGGAVVGRGFAGDEEPGEDEGQEGVEEEGKGAAAEADGRRVVGDQSRAGGEDGDGEPAGGLPGEELGEEGGIEGYWRSVRHGVYPACPHGDSGNAFAEGDDAEAEFRGGVGLRAGEQERFEGVLEGVLEELGIDGRGVAVAHDSEDEQPGVEDAEG